VKTDSYSTEEVAKVVQLRANVENLRLGPGVLDRLASEGERSSLRFVMLLLIMKTISTLIPYFRYALQLLTPASILATLAGRQQIELDDIKEMGELFLDAKTSAAAISDSGVYLS
jgi:RuvB-like protein 1